MLKPVLLFVSIFSIIFPSRYVFCEPTLPKAAYVTVDTAKQWIGEDRDVIFVDVREVVEYEKGHIKDAFNVPYAEAESRIAGFKKELTYVFYCTYSTWRAPYSANLFRDHEYVNSYILEGGVAAWNAGGQAIYSELNKASEVADYPKDLARDLKHPADRKCTIELKLTQESLKTFDGQDGRPAYVAINGIIYDVTQSRLWRGGMHDPGQGNIKAGQDLSELIKESPHGVKNLERFPIVGQLINRNI